MQVLYFAQKSLMASGTVFGNGKGKGTYACFKYKGGQFRIVRVQKQ